MSNNYLFAKVRQNGERFWTIVTEISGQNIKAIVDNDVFMQEFKCGDTINYLVDDVIEWQIPKINFDSKEVPTIYESDIKEWCEQEIKETKNFNSINGIFREIKKSRYLRANDLLDKFCRGKK